MKRFLSMLAGTCLILSAACSAEAVPTNGRLACSEFQTTSDSLSNELLSPIQFRDNITRVQELGSTAAPAIKDASALLIETMTQGDGTGFRMATTDMFAACTDAGFSNKGN